MLAMISLLLGQSKVQPESSWLLSRSVWHHCTLRVILPCSLLLWFIGAISGWVPWLLPLWEACLELSGTVNANPHGGGFQFKCSSGPLGPLGPKYMVSSATGDPSTFGKQLRVTAVACNILGVLYTTLQNRGPHAWCWVLLLDCLWLLGEALSAQTGMSHLNYVCLSMHRLVCILDIFQYIDNKMSPYDIFRLLTVVLPSFAFGIYLPPSLKLPPLPGFSISCFRTLVPCSSPSSTQWSPLLSCILQLLRPHAYSPWS